ncbi:hypothetical protein BTN50_1660 (plasmid) [Candidatus Enterovibrio altilux]|uniref:Uncharacterized protein n=1 Tax=Candidatus Enterovibrio altilux TaxID=1927128 RepID=A0A291BAR3_9GAMM|nr:hypothetical protein BTN50_1660 [Candidatus Enterovibrio luxaltus]
MKMRSQSMVRSNMQVIGLTQYGNGVIMSAIMDQAIRRKNCLF